MADTFGSGPHSVVTVCRFWSDMARCARVKLDQLCARSVEAIFATLPDPRAIRERLAKAFAVDVEGISLCDVVG